MSSSFDFEKDLLKHSHQGIRCDLSVIAAALDCIKNPQLSYPTIHIAGTNGKGSTSTLIATILSKAGYKTGLTISPHLYRVNERIQINQTPITDLELVKIYLKLKAQLSLFDLTYFEWMIVIAFEYFCEQKVDFAVIETGLGGRFDATNVVRPLVGVLTNVSYDHQKYLGDTLEKILSEKKEIFKSGMRAVSGLTDPNLKNLLTSHCTQKNIPLKFIDNTFESLPNNFFKYQNKIFEIGLQGEHQKQNGVLALMAIKELVACGIVVSDQAIYEGLKQTQLAGRLELISSSPRILVDVAHNEDGIKALCHYLDQQSFSGDVHVLFGCLADRDLVSLITPLLKRVTSVTVVSFIADGREMRLNEIQDKVSTMQHDHKPIRVMELTEENFKQWVSGSAKNDLLLVTGSFYVVGPVREWILIFLNKGHL